MSIKPKSIVVCSSCGSVGEAKRRGSGGVELCLWLFLLWPIALVYTVWRSSGAECRVCGSNALMPVTSPKAKELASGSSVASEEIQSAITKIEEVKNTELEQPKEDSKIWASLGLGFVFLMAMGTILDAAGPENEVIVMSVFLVVVFSFIVWSFHTPVRKMAIHRSPIFDCL